MARAASVLERAVAARRVASLLLKSDARRAALAFEVPFGEGKRHNPLRSRATMARALAEQAAVDALRSEARAA